MYGLIGSFRAHPGQRDALIAEMTHGGFDLPGLVSFIVAEDPADPDTIWITEIWESEAHHKGSLDIPFVRESINRALPMIAAFGAQTVTRPVAGTGL